MAHIRDELRVASGINILIGIWLVLAPFALGFADLPAARWNSIAVGVALVIVAAVRVATPLRTLALSWINVILGLWLIASPFLLGFTELAGAILGHVVVGLMVIALSAGSFISPRHQAD